MSILKVFLMSSLTLTSTFGFAPPGFAGPETKTETPGPAKIMIHEPGTSNSQWHQMQKDKKAAPISAHDSVRTRQMNSELETIKAHGTINSQGIIPTDTAQGVSAHRPKGSYYVPPPRLIANPGDVVVDTKPGVNAHTSEVSQSFGSTGPYNPNMEVASPVNGHDTGMTRNQPTHKVGESVYTVNGNVSAHRPKGSYYVPSPRLIKEKPAKDEPVKLKSVKE